VVEAMNKEVEAELEELNFFQVRPYVLLVLML
jgi:hypothetical protein